MEAWVELARALDCALLIDEFYSHYVWTTDARAPAPVSAAAHMCGT
jgi:aspartate/methionine/tyrosine aminotransferase